MYISTYIGINLEYTKDWIGQITKINVLGG
jgi:hypothetical protein